MCDISDPALRELCQELSTQIMLHPWVTALISGLAVIFGSVVTYIWQNKNNKNQLVREGKIATLKVLKDDLHIHRENFRKRRTHRRTAEAVVQKRGWGLSRFRTNKPAPAPFSEPFPIELESENESILEAHVALVGDPGLKTRVVDWIEYAKELYSSEDHELNAAEELDMWQRLIDYIGRLIRNPDL